MSSSGTATYVVGRNAMITDAFRKMRVLASGQTISADMLTDSYPRLNFILANLSSKGLPLWTYTLLQIPQVVGAVAYTLGPVAPAAVSTHVLCPRPLRLLDGSFIRDSTSGTDQDTPLRMISRQEYLQYGSKSVTGIPNTIYYESGMTDAFDSTLTSPSTGYGTLFVYTPLQTSATRTIFANMQRPIFSVSTSLGTSNEEFDLPQEWYLYLVYALAAELADDYEVPEDRIARLEGRRDQIRSDLMDWSVETASTSFAPMSYAGR